MNCRSTNLALRDEGLQPNVDQHRSARMNGCKIIISLCLCSLQIFQLNFIKLYNVVCFMWKRWKVKPGQNFSSRATDPVRLRFGTSLPRAKC